jgi:hypothetical protein
MKKAILSPQAELDIDLADPEALKRTGPGEPARAGPSAGCRESRSPLDRGVVWGGLEGNE